MATWKKAPTKKPATKKPQREPGKRPDYRIVIKTTADDFVPVLAYWDDPETGYQRGGLDSRVAAIKVQTTDGEVVTIRRDPKTGHHKGGFINLYLEVNAGTDEGGDDDDTF